MIDPGLAGKVILVTGGSNGIGGAISRAFVAQGARVAVHYLPSQAEAPEGAKWEHDTPAEGTALKFARELDGTVAVGLNLAEPHAADKLVDQVEKHLGTVDVLINNAAHCESPDAIGTLTEEGLERHYRVNAVVPAMLISELVKRKRNEAELAVVNISTDAAQALPGQIGYGTSKAAVEALTRAAALELGSSGIRINAVAPGPIQTGWMSEKLVDQAQAMIPLGRVGFPEDIADAVLYLASHQSRWVTGQVLHVDGGHAI